MLTVSCPRCSKRMPIRSTYCRRCGLQLASAESASPQVPSTGPGHSSATSTSPVDRSVKIVIAAAVLVAIGLVAGLAVLRTHSRSSVAESEHVAQAKSEEHTLAHERNAVDSQPPLPPLPGFSRHLPDDLPPAGTIPADRDFRGQMLTQVRHIEAPLRGAIFAGTHLLQATFEKAELRGADFRGADFLQTTLAGADLEGARFDGARFSQSYLVSVDTSAVSGRTQVRNGITEPVPPPPLPARNAGRASFRGTRFDGMNFDAMDLSGGDFRGASFDGGNFRDADLRRADLRDTRHRLNDFRGAKLDGADLRGADLTSARNLTPAQLATAVTDDTTRLPRQ